MSNFISFDSIGGLLTAGQWHSKGRPILYCTQNPSTALLETLVHIEIDAEDRPSCFRVLKIEGPDSLSIEVVNPGTLPRDWADDLAITQGVGDEWLASGTSLLLEVPSVLVPETWNVLVNPLHMQFGQLKIAKLYEHAFDGSLLK
jgi:RES domain-containing protein